MQFNRRALLNTFIATLASTSAAFAAEPAKPLIVGMELAYPPFEMTDTSGKPTGFSVDLATDLARSLGRPLVIQNTSFDGLIPALKTGKIDLVISSMTATEERAKSINFSDRYFSSGLCLLLKKASTAKGIADLNQAGVKVAVKKGTTGHIYAMSQLKNAQVLVFDKESAAVLEVSQAKADAFIYDQMSNYRNWQRNQETTRTLLEPFQKESWAIGISKDNSALKDQVNQFIKSYRTSGGFDKLGDRYLKEMNVEFKRLGYSFFL
ncbi:MAG: transporter substrate-binding domain-containing protein [Rhodoferax sp.]|nr:transporter substrate-binding domain-containing protein [Rhodoferax sp.]OIP22323.1 MAG: amino acid ABC transporter substrate-binding protein [Comamonadaceae bacterium CG2_30_60_41]PIW09074.1 MAG: amino acid ABC transporter substrate-binding protein [Comamonadaceae bacterium CG17_big_fil_post_rev_8_21_14_2_50_60_13]PIY25608.1 MAG: amino acid ABC transporter substrate-binding protein [Comamonadaceae bacterium CG_4_10_14_3_um_filter_60_75]PJC16007.1 MAG: amino acid ABC transporter substrate-bin